MREFEVISETIKKEEKYCYYKVTMSEESFADDDLLLDLAERQLEEKDNEGIGN
ncbi:MAG: hypothetical protein SVS85_01995 [Candidatus Nanohaloarchaea archaeon]|nr:hypothetical protein [Candidatus Nanohaloarchaea archaeon]